MLGQEQGAGCCRGVPLAPHDGLGRDWPPENSKSFRDVLHLDGCLSGIRLALPFLLSYARGKLWFGVSCLEAAGQEQEFLGCSFG